MFDPLSATPAPENEKAIACEEGFVNTNVVLQKVLQRLTNEERVNIVLRCDDLPLIPGTEEDYETVFTHLIRLILQKKEAVLRLFLHIHCTTEESETQKATSLKWFNIQLVSNIVPCADWMQANNERNAEIVAILHKNGGKLVVNQAKSSGCILSVFIPGKTF